MRRITYSLNVVHGYIYSKRMMTNSSKSVTVFSKLTTLFKDLLN
jgi:hypothetical protein